MVDPIEAKKRRRGKYINFGRRVWGLAPSLEYEDHVSETGYAASEASFSTGESQISQVAPRRASLLGKDFELPGTLTQRPDPERLPSSPPLQEEQSCPEEPELATSHCLAETPEIISNQTKWQSRSIVINTPLRVEPPRLHTRKGTDTTQRLAEVTCSPSTLAEVDAALQSCSSPNFNPNHVLERSDGAANLNLIRMGLSIAQSTFETIFPTSFHFLSLPTEIRFMIYAHVITPPLGHIDLLKPGGSPDLVLMQVNRQVCEEVRCVLYSDIPLRLEFWDLARRDHAVLEAKKRHESRGFTRGEEPNLLFQEFHDIAARLPEKRHAAGMEPVFVNKFRDVSFNIQLGEDQFRNHSFLIEHGNHLDPAHMQRASDFPMDTWAGPLQIWIEEFLALRQHSSSISTHNLCARLHWDTSDPRRFHCLIFITKQPPLRDIELWVRLLLCVWRDHLRGIMYLTRIFKEKHKKIEIDLGVTNIDGFIVNYEILDEEIVTGTFFTNGSKYLWKMVKYGTFKFDGIKLVEFSCPRV